MCVSLYVCVCHSTYVELKGELGRTDSLLLPCWSWDQSQVVRLCSTILSQVSHFTNPKDSVTFLLRPKQGTGVSPETTGFWWANLFHSLTLPSQTYWRFDVRSIPAFDGSKCLHGQLLSAPPPPCPIIIYLESPFGIWVLYYMYHYSLLVLKSPRVSLSVRHLSGTLSLLFIEWQAAWQAWYLKYLDVW